MWRASLPWMLCLLLVGGPWASRTSFAQPAPQPADVADNPEEKPEPSPFITEPKTADELFEATVLMANIARHKLARQYLDKLLEIQPDDNTLLAIRDKYGPAPFLRLTTIPAMQPAANTLLDQVTAAMQKRAADPARILLLLDQLAGEADDRLIAREELKTSGQPAIPFLIAALEDTNREAAHNDILQTLIEMGESAVPALVAALDSPDVRLRADALLILGRIGSRKAVPYLWYYATTEEQPGDVTTSARVALANILKTTPTEVQRQAGEMVVAQLMKQAVLYYQRQVPLLKDDQGLVTVWIWNSTNKTAIPQAVTPEVASEMEGLRLSGHALAIESSNVSAQTLYLSFLLASEVRRNGWDKPLPTGPGTAHDLAVSLGPDLTNDVLRQSLAEGRTDVSLAALKVLEVVGLRDQIREDFGSRSAILAALNVPDRRVQFAAARTVLQLDPQRPFSGSERVIEILKNAIITEGLPRAIVADVSVDRGSSIVGMLSEMGYMADLVSSGRNCFRMAAERSDVELIIVHANISRWALTETLANLRSDSRTAQIPIFIFGPESLREKLRFRMEAYPRIAYLAHASNTNDLATQMLPALRQILPPLLTEKQRLARRDEAVAWAAHLASGRRTKIFDIAKLGTVLGEVVKVPSLTANALEALGEIGSIASQRSLANVAMDAAVEASWRELAANKLAFHIQRFGLLLDKSQVAALHQAFQQAATPEVKTALAAVIGTLQPDATLTGKRLRNYRP